MNKMQGFAAIWPSTPKVHNKVVTHLSYQIWTNTSFETIYTMVEMSGVKGDEDILATARALRDLRNEWRKALA